MSIDDNHQPNHNNFKNLEAIIYVFGINKQIWKRIDDFLEAEGFRGQEQPNLSTILCGFDLKPRVWELLERRCGFHKRFTFDEISDDFGITKARLQQLERKAVDKVKNKLNHVIALLWQIDHQICQDWLSLQQAKTINEAVFLYQTIFTELGWLPPSGKEIRELLLIMRALIQANNCGIDRHLPNLSYAACFLSPTILKHYKLAEQEKEKLLARAAEEKIWKYEELAEAVLTASGKPLHYSEIIDQAEKLKRRNFISVKGMHNVLFSKQEKFAYVDQGTYGLTAWGLTSVDAYTDIIAEVLKSAQQPLPYGNVFQAVSAKRLVKPQTLQMTLDMNPRFYCSQEGTYGLRAWLPSRDKQTLRTPKFLVETLHSYERVDRAAERGYDIALIISQDKKLNEQ